ncbi:MAG: hypothetical protein HFI08_05560 [Bacilli bacterium]|nr:hypothetical protein [Bacilli bacterium]
MNVSIELLEFPLCIKNKILRIKNITKLNIEYIVGKNIVFNYSNLGINESHKIVISNNTQRIVLLCYNDVLSKEQKQELVFKYIDNIILKLIKRKMYLLKILILPKKKLIILVI